MAAQTIDLNPTMGLFIPIGIAHGFAALTDERRQDGKTSGSHANWGAEKRGGAAWSAADTVDIALDIESCPFRPLDKYLFIHEPFTVEGP